jgi:zinc/manganese transport system substrate-binding protein
MRTRVLALVVAVAVGFGAAACTAPAATADGRLHVVTTTTVFADMVKNVGRDLVAVSSLVPSNADVHTFSPRPSDIRTLAEARLVIRNGLGLDDWLTKMIDAVATGAPVVVLAENLPGVDYLTGEDESGPANPHVWMNVAYGELYVDRIAGALEAADPTHAGAYRAQGATYRATLTALDAQIAADLGAIPIENRRVVAFHDAFPYYAQRYGLDIVGVAVAAPGQDPGASYTAKLIDAIRAAHVKAIFSEAQFPPKLVQQLAAETGTTVVATLYDDALGDPPADTYLGVMRWDTDEFVRALR